MGPMSLPGGEQWAAERRSRVLAEQQFNSLPEQPGLFSEDHPAMRPLEYAEMRPDQYQRAPGVYHHATYRAAMPQRSTTHASAGIHLGSFQAAKERVDNMGPRDVHRADIHADESKPADIHARHLNPEKARRMLYSPEKPGTDRDDSWGEDYQGNKRGAQEFGEYYSNQWEDAGSISIRVPDATYLSSHRAAVNDAIRAEGRVHPLNRVLHYHDQLDQPQQYTAHTDKVPDRGAFEFTRRMNPSLLPYKMEAAPQSGRVERVKNPHTPTGYSYQPAITFVESEKEAKDMQKSKSWVPRTI